MKSFVRMFVFVGVLGMFASPLFAEEVVTPKIDDKAASEKTVMMEKMKAMTSPGAAHKVLEPLAGKWTYASKFWMSADGKPEESTGTSDQMMIFGGRFLKQDVKGAMMGQPFEGIGYLGYDNIKGEYTMTWMDSMITGTMTMSGQFDAVTKTLHTTGANSCPMTGEKARAMRWDWAITDDAHNTFTGYMNGPDGKEFKGMEIVYTKVQ